MFPAKQYFTYDFFIITVKYAEAQIVACQIKIFYCTVYICEYDLNNINLLCIEIVLFYSRTKIIIFTLKSPWYYYIIHENGEKFNF